MTPGSLLHLHLRLTRRQERDVGCPYNSIASVGIVGYSAEVSASGINQYGIMPCHIIMHESQGQRGRRTFHPESVLRHRYAEHLVITLAGRGEVPEQTLAVGVENGAI